ncbi:MAG: hypothetical protein HKM87_01770 [Ignavibacteriaceae bacterium]|nr:hypothetical protein [Ignavibacteriaceae bacterium]
MKIISFFLLLTGFSFSQQLSMQMAGLDIELGMEKETLLSMIDYGDYMELEDENGNIFLSHKGSEKPVGIINFKDNRVVKLQKDWGTSLQSSVGKVFKILWKIFRQYGEETEMLKVMPNEIFTPTHEQYSLNFYLDENRYVEILIQHRVLIFEVLEAADVH